MGNNVRGRSSISMGDTVATKYIAASDPLPTQVMYDCYGDSQECAGLAENREATVPLVIHLLYHPHAGQWSTRQFTAPKLGAAPQNHQSWHLFLGWSLLLSRTQSRGDKGHPQAGLNQPKPLLSNANPFFWIEWSLKALKGQLKPTLCSLNVSCVMATIDPKCPNLSHTAWPGFWFTLYTAVLHSVSTHWGQKPFLYFLFPPPDIPA